MAETLTQGAGSFVLQQSVPINRPFWFGTTGQTVAVTISKNGAAFASALGAVAEIANGWYNIQLNAGDVATLGVLAYHATAGSGGPADFCDLVVVQVYGAATAGGPQLSLNLNNQPNISSNCKQGQTLLLPFTMTSTASGAPLTGLAITAQRNFGIGWSACGGVITELGFGDYAIALTTADTNSPSAMYRFTASAANDVNISMIFQP